MLEDIEELRSAISMSMSGSDNAARVQSIVTSQRIDDTAVLFGAVPGLTFEQVLTQYVPPRQETDRLVATYFRSKAVKAPFLDQTHFQTLYLAFWTTPFASPPLFVSRLFSVLHASATFLAVSDVADNRYAVAAARCLVTGKHYQPKQHAFKAVLLYAQIKYFTQLAASADIGNVFGMATRTALRMGYHRDPGRFSISPFEQEMRRRAWSTLLQLELLIASQLGLPSSILPGSYDTIMPANLQDADFDENTTEMPPVGQR